MKTRHAHRGRFAIIGAATFAATALCAVHAAHAGDGACADASSQTPGPNDGAIVTIQWGGIWADSCTPFGPEFPGS